MKKIFLNLLDKWGLDRAEVKKTLLIALAIWAVLILPGITMWLFNWNGSRSESAPMVASTESTAVVPTPPPTPVATPAPAESVAVAPAVAPTPAPASVPPPVPAPAPPAVVQATPAPAPTPPPVLANPVVNAAPSVPTIVYQDNFGRKGELDGSSPDAKNTNSAKWTVSSGPGAYATKGGAVSDSNATYDAAFLPVNGTSGVALDGKENFTLSATVTPETGGYWMGISLNTAPISNGHNLNDNGVVELIIGRGYADAYDHGSSLIHAENDYTAGVPYVISMTYHATKGAITYTVGDKVIATLPGVKANQIAALCAVTMGNGHSGPTGEISNFTLTVGGVD